MSPETLRAMEMSQAEPASGVPIAALERKLYRLLKLPLPEPSQPAGAPSNAKGEAWSEFGLRPVDERIGQLRQLTRQLREEAAKIGAIPADYPRHIDILMRLISALLPWYTRSLVKFGERTVDTVQALSATVEELLRRQELLAAELKRRKA